MVVGPHPYHLFVLLAGCMLLELEALLTLRIAFCAECSRGFHEGSHRKFPLPEKGWVHGTGSALDLFLWRETCLGAVG